MGVCCAKCPTKLESKQYGLRPPYPRAYEAVLLLTGSSMFSQWFPGRGDYLIATLDLIQAVSAKIEVLLATKN